jgi:hypothetical protein
LLSDSFESQNNVWGTPSPANPHGAEMAGVYLLKIPPALASVENIPLNNPAMVKPQTMALFLKSTTSHAM